MDKYLNYATIGDEKIIASFSEKGELLRLFYPTVDYKQFVEWLHIGVKINDSINILLHDDENNVYKQRYVENTNILQTEIFNTYFNLRILQIDFVPINENIVVKKYIFKNESQIDLNINLLVDSNILTNINNDTSGYVKNDALIQYNHDYTVCLFSNETLLSYQVNNVKENIWKGEIGGKDYIGLSNNSAISYDLNALKPGEEREFSLFLMINDNNQKNLLGELDEELNRVKNLNVNVLFNNCKKYWEEFVDRHDKLNIRKSSLDEKIKNIYIRTILLYPLLHNKETGGISAGLEVDEWKTRCGRYSYCWPRDGVFITKAFDILGMKEGTSKFYNVFCRKTQNKKGNWEQRFYTDGRLAPSWGYQIDETASVIIGLYDHYLEIKDIEFLKSNNDMIKKAVEFLMLYLDDILNEKYKMQKSYDLWEEHEGVSLYSLASIYAAIKCTFKINIILETIEENNVLDEYSLKIQKFVSEKFFNEETKTYVRNLEDKKMDSSILGIAVPFGMIEADSREMKNTVQKMEMTLRTFTGGFLRYENDTYMGGNPWVISTLWMALYYIEINEKEKAIECFNFAINSCSEHGFLSEQVDNKTMSPIWVIGLAWSHAMFIIVLQKLLEKGMLY